jgi:hypothetical protein
MPIYLSVYWIIFSKYLLQLLRPSYMLKAVIMRLSFWTCTQMSLNCNCDKYISVSILVVKRYATKRMNYNFCIKSNNKLVTVNWSHKTIHFIILYWNSKSSKIDSNISLQHSTKRPHSMKYIAPDSFRINIKDFFYINSQCFINTIQQFVFNLLKYIINEKGLFHVYPRKGPCTAV